MYVHARPLHLASCLALAALAMLIVACSQASEPTTEPAPRQEPAGGLLQDAPPTKQLEAVELDIGRAPSLDTKMQTAKDCPKVKSPLSQIIQGPNPLETAKQLGFRVQGDRIQVLVVLKDEDSRFLEDYDVEVGKQSGTQVQAFVPLPRLCELADSDNVLAIRLPDQAVGP